MLHRWRRAGSAQVRAPLSAGQRPSPVNILALDLCSLTTLTPGEHPAFCAKPVYMATATSELLSERLLHWNFPRRQLCIMHDLTKTIGWVI